MQPSQLETRDKPALALRTIGVHPGPPAAGLQFDALPQEGAPNQGLRRDGGSPRTPFSAVTSAGPTGVAAGRGARKGPRISEIPPTSPQPSAATSLEE